ncbi:MAG: hypothetical protein H7X89_15790, partial [Rhizobiales bacterium]|nr:hypothetical protein [Hyphomicrobiales bacterium]
MAELLQRPDLSLIMVDRWESVEGPLPSPSDPVAQLTPRQMAAAREAALARTRFAAARRTIMIADSLRAAEPIAPA